MQILDTSLRLLRPLLLLPLGLLCLAAAGAAGGAQADVVPEDEAFTLGLGPAGALLEACFHAHAWVAAHPGEEARVPLLEQSDGSPVQVRRAAVVYSRQGRLYARDFRGPAQELQGLSPKDLANEALFTTRLPAPPADPAPDDSRDPDRILPDALLRLKRHPQGLGFPAAISGVPSRSKRPDGSVESVVLPWLVCDYGDLHCLYRPGSSFSTLFRIPRNSVTGKALACIPRGDLVEALLFHADFTRQQPAEKAELLADWDVLASQTPGTTAVAFTQKGVLKVFNTVVGALEYSGRGPKDLKNVPLLADDFPRRLQAAYVRAYTAKHGTASGRRAGYSDFSQYLGLACPEALPGDTPQLQVLRLHQRLLASGLPSRLQASSSSDAGYRLTLEAQGHSLSYSTGRGLLVSRERQNSQEGVSVEIRRDERAPRQRVMPRLSNSASGQATALVPDERFIAHLEEEIAKGRSEPACELAAILIEGRYVKRDLARAKALLAEAAAKGHGESALTYARLLNKDGQDDEGLALQLSMYEIAARAGFSEAQYNLGAMISSGRGCKRDWVLGLAWLIVAGKNGVTGKGEQEIRTLLVSTPERIVQAENRATELLREIKRLEEAAP